MYNKESTKISLARIISLKMPLEDEILTEAEPVVNRVPQFGYKFDFTNKKGGKRNPNDNKIEVRESNNYLRMLLPGKFYL